MVSVTNFTSERHGLTARRLGLDYGRRFEPGRAAGLRHARNFPTTVPP
jgi:hypothetical protein